MVKHRVKVWPAISREAWVWLTGDGSPPSPENGVLCPVPPPDATANIVKMLKLWCQNWGPLVTGLHQTRAECHFGHFMFYFQNSRRRRQEVSTLLEKWINAIQNAQVTDKYFKCHKGRSYKSLQSGRLSANICNVAILSQTGFVICYLYLCL